MGEFRAVPGLDEMVAQMVAPEVRKVAESVHREARKGAPAAKRWVSMSDGKVRPTHVEAHGQQIPENLRYHVTSMEWDRQHRGVGPVTYMLRPKDDSSRAVANIKNCRCVSALDPTAIARRVKIGPTKVYGTEISIEVSCSFYKIVECEFGDSYTFGNVSPGTRFMGNAAARVAQQTRVAT